MASPHQLEGFLKHGLLGPTLVFLIQWVQVGTRESAFLASPQVVLLVWDHTRGIKTRDDVGPCWSCMSILSGQTPPHTQRLEEGSVVCFLPS